MADDNQKFMRTKVFVNHVDTYTGEVLSKVLSQATVGGTLQEEDDDQSKTSMQEGLN